MESTGYDDMIVSIVKRDTSEVIFPTLYTISRINIDEKNNVLIEIIKKEDESRAFIVFPANEIPNFVSDLKNGLAGSSFVTTKEWFVIYFPAIEDEEQTVWMCKLSSILTEGSKILIVFNWVYYKENEREAIARIKEFANSDEIRSMGKVFDSLRYQGSDDIQGAILDLSEKTGLQFLDLNKEFSPVDAAIQILRYKRFNNMYMKMNSEKEPLNIVLDMNRENVEKIVVGLEKLA